MATLDLYLPEPPGIKGKAIKDATDTQASIIKECTDAG